MGIRGIGRSPLWKATVDNRRRAGVQIHCVFQGLKGVDDPITPACKSPIPDTEARLTTESSIVVEDQRERSVLQNRIALRSDVSVEAPVGCRARP
jgi:hypothetical protein